MEREANKLLVCLVNGMGNNSVKIIIKMMLPNPRTVFTSSEKRVLLQT